MDDQHRADQFAQRLNESNGKALTRGHVRMRQFDALQERLAKDKDRKEHYERMVGERARDKDRGQARARMFAYDARDPTFLSDLESHDARAQYRQRTFPPPPGKAGQREMKNRKLAQRPSEVEKDMRKVSRRSRSAATGDEHNLP